MNPISVRSTSSAKPSSRATIWSIPGATNPVQLATTRCVVPSTGTANRPIAASASAGAASPYTRIRALVGGEAPA